MIHIAKYNIKDKVEQATTQEYDTKSFIIIFFLSAFIGWVLEVVLELIDNGRFVNRGVLIGPYLPIYGYGCLLVLLTFSKTKLKKVSSNAIATFLLITLFCTILEYCTSIFLETVYGMKWWDYSNNILNFQGRISLITSLFFGIAGCFALYDYAPFINNKIEKIPNKIITAICIILICIYLIDSIYCIKYPNMGEGITIKVTNLGNLFKS
ncbi:MAG: putative ABC transporter permease [Clostridia bacterium]|nr:putative ABC transporter permease [Clostridia bacterium]